MDKQILLGYSQLEDPLKDSQPLTKYKIIAGQCPECGCSKREILCSQEYVCLKCSDCKDLVKTAVKSYEWQEVTYVYWCSNSRFKSDETEISEEFFEYLTKLEKELSAFEKPSWAVEIVGGICLKSNHCINKNCPYMKSF